MDNDALRSVASDLRQEHTPATNGAEHEPSTESVDPRYAEFLASPRWQFAAGWIKSQGGADLLPPGQPATTFDQHFTRCVCDQLYLLTSQQLPPQSEIQLLLLTAQLASRGMMRFASGNVPETAAQARDPDPETPTNQIGGL